MDVHSSNLSELEQQFRKIERKFDLIVVEDSRTPLQTNDSQPIDAISQVPAAQGSIHNILNALNDDCLHEIFDREEIDVMDLVSIANVCTRFNVVAKQAFKKKYSKKSAFELLDPKNVLWQPEQIFRTFGEKITSISFDNIPVECMLEAHLHMVLEHCVNLKVLKCSLFGDHSIEALRRALPHLEELTLSHANDKVMMIFTKETVQQLKKLHIPSCAKLELPRVHMPQLVDVELGITKITGLDRHDNFIRLNPQIQMLSIRTFDVQTECGLDSLAQLKCLKTFCLHVDPKNYYNTKTARQMLQVVRYANNDLENLALEFEKGQSYLFIDEICRFDNVTSLRIKDDMEFTDLHRNDDCLGRITSEMKKLQCSHLENVGSLCGVTSALRMADQLKKAYFVARITRENASQILWSQLKEIDAIRRQKAIDLRILIQAGGYPDGNVS